MAIIEAELIEECERPPLIDSDPTAALRASAMQKLTAGEPLSEDEARVIVGLTP